ncbi:unnamed protein product, partial [Fusarium graminearum]
DDVEAKPACHPRACAIQNCLTSNGYNEAKCQTVIKQLYECCESFYERYGEEASTVRTAEKQALSNRASERNDQNNLTILCLGASSCASFHHNHRENVKSSISATAIYALFPYSHLNWGRLPPAQAIRPPYVYEHSSSI